MANQHFPPCYLSIDEATYRQGELQDAQVLAVCGPPQVIWSPNFLTVPHSERACESYAGRLRGKTTEEMRDILGVKNDFTPEEEVRGTKYRLEFLSHQTFSFCIQAKLRNEMVSCLPRLICVHAHS